MVELLTTFGRLNRGDRVRLSGESKVLKVAAALPYPEDYPGCVDVRVSFGKDGAVIAGKKEFVWLVFPPG